jgi:hypothetical protein
MCLAALGGCGTGQPVFTTNHDWSEPLDPATSNPALWADMTRPVASWGSVDVRYPLHEPFAGEIAAEQTLAGWRGERVHAQLVVSTPVEIGGMVCEVSDLRGESGGTIAGAGGARFVKSVLADYLNPDTMCGGRQPGEPSRIVADLLDPAPSLTAAARTTRPVWITVEIPADAAPGLYSGKVRVHGKGFSETLTLRLEVSGRVLPPPGEWSYHLDLWQHPSSVARVEGVAMWSDAHFDAMRPVMGMLAGAGQKVITATLNKDPWNNQCFDPYADMITWTRGADGGWTYDFAVFDRWVEFMLGLGVTRAINCYSMLPWNNMLHYVDGATGSVVEVKADPGTPEFRAMWEPFLPAFVAHLREKGWLEITSIAMDERPLAQMTAVVELLGEVAPELGIALADSHGMFRQFPHIRDMCASIFGPIDRADIADRRGRGLHTTFYVCCSSDFPNTYTFSDPAEAVWLAWYAAAMDYDGFLRWSYNSWVEDPIRDSRFRRWAAGDTYIVYPEGRSSIRFERLREGIQDFEKMRILRGAGLGPEIDALLAPFGTDERTPGWNDRLNEARRAINGM